jgi:hypothetical protein
MHATCLLAVGIEIGLLIKAIVALILFFSWVANKLSGKQAPPRVPPGRAPSPPNRPAAGDAMQNQIEDFVRQMQNRQSKPTPRATLPETASRSPNKPNAAKPTRKATPPTSLAASSSKGDAVAEHVRKHLDEQDFTKRAERLTDDIQQVDEAREEHLRQVFTHQVGRLQDTSTAAAIPNQPELSKPTEVTGAAAVVNPLLLGLSNPVGLRQAFILREIFDVPTSRWE